MITLVITNKRSVGFAMSAVEFPDPYSETLEGVIAIGGKLSVENLVKSYSLGIFPWPHRGFPLLWFCPDERGVLDFKDLYLPTSFKKWLRKNTDNYKITINKAFDQVIKECRLQIRSGQQGTWITSAIEKTYTEMFFAGYAISVEVWNINKNQLVGGIYGVQSVRYFSCESMFFKESNCSKLALVAMVEYLASIGFTWMDIQMVSDVSQQFGGKLIPKKSFLQRIGV